MNVRFALFILVGSLALLTACENLPFPWDDFDNPDAIPMIKILSEPEVRALPRDAVEIDSVSIENDVITFKVTYGGGCAEHDFILANFGGFMESWPVQTKVLLSHDDHDDPCDALETRQIKFNLTPLKILYKTQYPNTDGIIVLQIIGPETSLPVLQIRYRFK